MPVPVAEPAPPAPVAEPAQIPVSEPARTVPVSKSEPPIAEPPVAVAEPHVAEPPVAVAVHASSDVPTLPSACVVPPQRRYRMQVTASDAVPGNSPEPEPSLHEFTSEPIDLDGDGQPDLAVPLVRDGDCPHEVNFVLYVMRGSCGHEVGTVLGSPVTSVHRRPRHLYNIETDRRWAQITNPRRVPGPNNVAMLHESHVRYTENHGRYAAGAPVETSGTCHHCPIPSCRLLPP